MLRLWIQSLGIKQFLSVLQALEKYMVSKKAYSLILTYLCPITLFVLLLFLIILYYHSAFTWVTTFDFHINPEIRREATTVWRKLKLRDFKPFAQGHRASGQVELVGDSSLASQLWSSCSEGQLPNRTIFCTPEKTLLAGAWCGARQCLGLLSFTGSQPPSACVAPFRPFCTFLHVSLLLVENPAKKMKV